MNRRLAQIAFIFLIVPLVAVADSTLEPDTDRLGMDYTGFDVPTAQPSPCQEACDLDRRCKAYTFVKPGVKGPQARCYLKSGSPPATPDQCCTSGVKLAPSVLDGVRINTTAWLFIAGFWAVLSLAVAWKSSFHTWIAALWGILVPPILLFGVVLGVLMSKHYFPSVFDSLIDSIGSARQARHKVGFAFLLVLPGLVFALVPFCLNYFALRWLDRKLFPSEGGE